MRTFGLCVALAFFAWGGGGVSIGVGLLVLGHLLIPGKTPVLPGWVLGSAAALAAVFLVSGLLSEDTARGIYEFKGLWPIMGLFAAAATVRDSQHRWVFALVLVISAFAGAAYGLYIWFDSPNYWTYGKRVPTNIWRFNLAMAHGLACAVYLALQARSTTQRTSYALIAATIACAFFAIGERMPVLLACVMVLIVCGMAVLRQGSRRVALASLILVGLVSVTGASNAQFRDLITQSPAEIWQGEQVRVSLWRGAWSMIQDAPLFGTGIGDASRDLRITMRDEFDMPNAPAAHAHSNVLHLLAAAGIPGGLAYLAFAIALLVPVARERAWSTPGGFLCLWSWSYFVLWGLIEGTLFHSYFFAPFCLLYGLGVGQLRRETESLPKTCAPRPVRGVQPLPPESALRVAMDASATPAAQHRQQLSELRR